MSIISGIVGENNISISVALREVDKSISGILSDKNKMFSGVIPNFKYRAHLSAESTFELRAHELLANLIATAESQDSFFFGIEDSKLISSKNATIDDVRLVISSIFAEALSAALSGSESYSMQIHADLVSTKFRLMRDLVGLTMSDIYHITMDELYMITEE
ncbi:hypothetical protein SDC9_50574 [bioreactor metagenome]|uniref:Uncharacterized protein n=1 Tax=bioreactor metagenome TaxID=1076179 RepID=A0A644WLC4_9ZZZZ